MRTIKTIILVLIIWVGSVYASATLLSYEGAPQVIGVGKCYDLLDIYTPMTRTYSGAYAIKNKSELNINLNKLVENAGYVSFLLGLKREVVKGLKLGAYGTYAGTGKFEMNDEDGNLIKKVAERDILFGLPIIFDAKSIRTDRADTSFMEELGSEELSNALARQKRGSGNFKKVFFNSINAGLNLNLYTYSFNDDVTLYFTTDVNVSAKYQLGYIGMPEVLKTVDEVEKEKLYEIQQYKENIYIPAKQKIAENEDYNEEDKKERIRILDENMAKYTNKVIEAKDNEKVDIGRVHATRQDIFKVYNDQQKELEVDYSIKFISNVRKEVNALLSSARGNVAKNFSYQQDTFNREMSNNTASITYYSGALNDKSANEELKTKVKELMDNYNYELEQKYAEKKKKAYSDKKHTVAKGDSWDSISRKYYQDISYAGALQGYNERYGQALPPEGNVIMYLSTSDMKAYFEEYKLELEERELKRGFKEYLVKEGDSWEAISMNNYQNQEMVKMLKKVNKNKEDTPPVGETIKVPILEAKELLEKRGSRFVEEQNIIQDAISAMELTDLESLYYEGIIRVYGERRALYEYREAAKQDRDNKNRTLNNMENDQRNLIDENQDTLVKELKKAKLKKQYDYLGIDQSKKNYHKKERDAHNDYKRREKVIFKTLLLDIYRIKKELNRAAMEEEKKRIGYIRADKKREVIRKLNTADENYKVAIIEAAEDPAKQEEVKAEFTKQRDLINEEYEADVKEANRTHKVNKDGLDWQLYLDQLVYLGSDEKRNTFATGFYVKNIGPTIKVFNKHEKVTPSVGMDFNYEYLNMENHNGVLYLHYGWSRYEDHCFGFGTKYKIFDMIELRAGLSLENSMVQPGFGAGFLFNVGLMNYKLDVGVKFVDPSFGNLLNLGITVIF